MQDAALVIAIYEECWRRSKGRYNAWVAGRLHPLALQFYIAVNATERCLMGGVPSLLDERRFGLGETAEAFEAVGLPRHAAVVRKLNALVGDAQASRDRRQRATQRDDLKLSPADVDRLNREFPMSKADEQEAWARLADFARRQPEAFQDDGDAA